MPAMWSPGDPPLFTDDARDAQPARSPINNQGFPLGPRTTGFFATDIELDFLRPVALGERLGPPRPPAGVLYAEGDHRRPRRLHDALRPELPFGRNLSLFL
jgi:hypothetical protein